MQELITHSAAETAALGEQIGKTCKPGTVIAFFGGLGAGKTAFTSGLAKGLGLSADVSSPTFALVHVYEGEVTLCHFDMYRIHSWEDLESTGFFEYLDRRAVLAVEWSENIEAVLPEDAVYIRILSGSTETERRILIGTKEELGSEHFRP